MHKNCVVCGEAFHLDYKHRVCCSDICRATNKLKKKAEEKRRYYAKYPERRREEKKRYYENHQDKKRQKNSKDLDRLRKYNNNCKITIIEMRAALAAIRQIEKELKQQLEQMNNGRVV